MKKILIISCTLPFLSFYIMHPMESRPQRQQQSEIGHYSRDKELSNRLKSKNIKPTILQALLDDGAYITSDHVCAAIERLCFSNIVLPMLVLFENGLDINATTENGTSYINATFFSQLCEFSEFEQAQWAQTQDPVEEAPDYPRGPFESRDQASFSDKIYWMNGVLDWLLEQGMEINRNIPLDKDQLSPGYCYLRFLADNLLSSPIEADAIALTWLLMHGARFNPKNIHDQVIVEAINKLFPDAITQAILCDHQDAAIGALETNKEMQEKFSINEYIIAASAQNRARVLGYLVKAYPIDEQYRRIALLTAAGAGHLEIVQLLINVPDQSPSYSYTVSRMILRAAVQNRTKVLDFLLKYIAETETFHKITLDRTLMHHAFVRSIRQGHTNSITKLFHLINVKLQEEQDKVYFAETMTEALRMAVARLDTPLFSFLLNIAQAKEITSLLDLRRIGHRLSNTLANPTINNHHQAHNHLLSILKEYLSIYTTIKRTLKNGYSLIENPEIPLSWLPPELIVYIMSFLIRNSLA